MSFVFLRTVFILSSTVFGCVPTVPTSSIGSSLFRFPPLPVPIPIAAPLALGSTTAVEAPFEASVEAPVGAPVAVVGVRNESETETRIETHEYSVVNGIMTQSLNETDSEEDAMSLSRMNTTIGRTEGLKDVDEVTLVVSRTALLDLLLGTSSRLKLSSIDDEIDGDVVIQQALTARTPSPSHPPSTRSPSTKSSTPIPSTTPSFRLLDRSSHPPPTRVSGVLLPLVTPPSSFVQWLASYTVSPFPRLNMTTPKPLVAIASVSKATRIVHTPSHASIRVTKSSPRSTTTRSRKTTPRRYPTTTPTPVKKPHIHSSPLLFVLANRATSGTTTTTAASVTTTTTASSTDCCPALTQTLSSTEFPDGVMTFTYDSDTCRTTVTANCSQTDPAFDLFAAIVANDVNYLDYASGSVTFPGNCTDGQWHMGSPPLLISTLECLLTNPPTA